MVTADIDFSAVFFPVFFVFRWERSLTAAAVKNQCRVGARSFNSAFTAASVKFVRSSGNVFLRIDGSFVPHDLLLSDWMSLSKHEATVSLTCSSWSNERAARCEFPFTVCLISFASKRPWIVLRTVLGCLIITWKVQNITHYSQLKISFFARWLKFS